MSLKRSEQMLIGATVALVALLGSYFLISSLAGRWQSIRRQVTTRERELTGIQATIQRKPEWERESKRLRDGLGSQQQRFEQMSDLLKRIDEVSTTTGVIVSARRPLPVVERGSYREFAVQYTFEATTESLVHFLHAIQTGATFIDVEQLQVAPRPDNLQILRGDIQLRALTGVQGKAAS